MAAEPCPGCGPLELHEIFATDRVIRSSQKRPWESLEKAASTCRVCAWIVELIELQVGPLNGRDTTCKFTIQGYAELLREPSGGLIRPNGISHFDADVTPVNRLAISLLDHAGVEKRLDVSIQLGASAAGTDLGRGRAVVPVLDVESLLSGWIETCRTDHGANCQPMAYSSSLGAFTLRVIDVHAKRLVHLPDSSDYAVLSYVWGGSEQVRLLQSNLDAFLQVRGLESIWSQLPKTISDALGLTELMGYRYLWVDSLCIIQDDQVDLESQIPNMHLVYGCASVTIVAAAGSSANAGLPGVPGSTSRSSFPSVPLGDGQTLFAGLPLFASAVYESVWETRGWTFQEKVLSRRLVIFTERQVYYHCNSETWCEDAVWENKDPRIQLRVSVTQVTPYYQYVSLPSPRLSGLHKLFHLVTGYNARQLTKESDTLDAFSGALSSLGAEIKSEFLWGLPLAYFHQTLLWSFNVHDPKLRRSGFPGWSWVGWKASVLPGDIIWPGEHHNHVATYSFVKVYQFDEQGCFHEIPEAASADEGPACEGLEDEDFAAEPLPEADLRQRLSVLANPRQALSFLAEIVRLRIFSDSDGGGTNFHQFGSMNYNFGFFDDQPDEPPKRMKCGRIALNMAWIESLDDASLEFDFIILGVSELTSLRDKNAILERVNLMMVQTVDGVSQRIQVTHVEPGWLPWFRIERRAIILG
jgi:hypothetical protein